MGGQTSISNQALGFPGQRVGTGHRARTGFNDTGAVRQVDDVTVDTAADATAYQFEVDGIAVQFTSGTGATVTTIRDGLLAAARALQELEDIASFNPTGTDAIRITAAQQGTGYALTETDVNLSTASVTANVSTQVIPFGRAVVRRTTGANVKGKSIKLPDAASQEFQGVSERIHSVVDPTNASSNPGAASAFQDLTAVHEGEMLVDVEEAVTAGDPVFFRHTAGAGGTKLGIFRNDADTASADQVTGAKFTGTSTGAGTVAASFNSA